MIRFDPYALTTFLHNQAETVRANVDAPAVVMQVDRGPLTVTTATGVSDLATGHAAQANQTFEIGSQTKMMTAVMILQLVQQGVIDLDAKAADYLPAAVIAGIANADTATVRQMLNMTAGLPNYTEAVDANGIPLFVDALLQNPDQVFGPKQALEIARGMEATGAPGEAYYYSNTNFLLLGKIIEAQTGKSFFAALQDTILTPAGMTDTVRQLGTDDPRLSSYLENPATGELIDVTRAQWEMRGEAGVVSTTTDMISFLKALFIDKTLLGPEALADMMDGLSTGANDQIATFFGLGLVKFTLANGHTFVGFTGGTLGTVSSTYLDLETGMVISLAGTAEDVDTTLGGLKLFEALEAAAAWSPNDDGSPLRMMSGSAGHMQLTETADGLRFALAGAALTLDRDLRATTTQSVRFADGSVIVVGDNARGTTGDDAANRVDILRDFAAAADKDNQILGLGGNDRLRGGHGDDRVLGGQGNDALWGRDGDDRLAGSAGRDMLMGGLGADTLRGGAGADTFVFRSADQSPIFAGDVIRDFQKGTDHVDLSLINAGTESGAFIWRGTDVFTGTSGEVRVIDQAKGTFVRVDMNGDGLSDMGFFLQDAHGITTSDFLL